MPPFVFKVYEVGREWDFTGSTPSPSSFLDPLVSCTLLFIVATAAFLIRLPSDTTPRPSTNYRSPSFRRHNFNFGAPQQPSAPKNKVQYGLLNMPVNK